MNNVPNLRFKEFSGGWENKKIGEITIKVGSGKTPKGGNAVYKDKGVIFLRSQNVLNGKLSLNDVAYITEDINSSMKSTEVYPDDILLNITGASIGRSCCIPKTFDKANVNQHVCIIRLDRNHNPNFVMNQIISSKFQKQIDSFQAGGNREGLNFEQIKGMRISSTTIEEQEKIAAFFSLIDKKIELQTEKVEELKNYKMGIMQKIFSRELRFKDENGNDYPEWEEKKLSELLYEHRVRNDEEKFTKNDVLSVSGDFGIVNQIKFLGRSYAGESVKNYHVVHTGDIVYTKSPLKSNPYGIIKVNKGDTGIVSTLYAVYSCKDSLNGEYLDYYFQLDDNTNRYLRPLVHKGAKNDMKINNEHVLSDKILICSVREQDKIVEFIKVIDKKIKNEENKLFGLNEYKKGLLQKMFI